MKYAAILLLGPPGAGKGTQGKMLGRIPGFHHSSSGDMFRALDPNSPTGHIFAEHAGRGELVPDDVTVAAWKQHIRRLVSAGRFDPQRDILILDGIPRNVRQAEMLDDTIDMRKVIELFAADSEVLVQRLRGRALKENRPDDADESVIRHRLKVHEANTAPLVRHYPPQIIERIDATGSPQQVHEQILKVVEPMRSQ